MHHFFLAVAPDDVRAMTTPFLPRVGDTVHIDGYDMEITKVTWMCDGKRIEDKPILNVYVDHTAGSTDTIAIRIAKTHGQNGERLIQAIKEHRAVTGMGLKESKEVMEDAFRTLGWRR